MTDTEIAAKLTDHEGRIKNIENDNANIHELVTSVAVMAEQIKSMSENIGILSAEVKSIKERPEKRWDKVIDVAIGLIAGAIVGLLLQGVGLG